MAEPYTDEELLADPFKGDVYRLSLTIRRLQSERDQAIDHAKFLSEQVYRFQAGAGEFVEAVLEAVQEAAEQAIPRVARRTYDLLRLADVTSLYLGDDAREAFAAPEPTVSLDLPDAHPDPEVPHD